MLLTSEEGLELAEHIKAGIEWLNSKQDPEAIMSHHGTTCGPFGVLKTVHLIPRSVSGRPAFVFNHEERHALEIGETDWQGYTEADILELKDLVSKFVNPAHDWNGESYGSYSLAIQTGIGKGLEKALQNYRAAGPRIFDNDWWKRHPIRVTKPEGWR